MRFIGLVCMAVTALSPASTLPAAPPAPTRDWGYVPDIALQPPADGRWGPGGWQATPGAPPPAAAPIPAGPASPAAASARGAPSKLVPHPGFDGAYRDIVGDERGIGRDGTRGGRPALRRGYRLPGYFLSPGYAIADWNAYGLGSPGIGNSWVRYYDGAALIDGTGTVRDYRDRVNWGPGHVAGDYATGYSEGWRDGFDGGADYASDAVTYRGARTRGGAGRTGYGASAYRGYGYDAPRYGYGYGTPGYGYDGAYGAGNAQVYSGEGGRIVVVQPAVSTTTTTVEEE